MERVRTLEAQLAALERARAAEQTAAEQAVVSGEEGEARLGAPASCVLGSQGIDGRRPAPPSNEGTTFWSHFHLCSKAPAHEIGCKKAAFSQTPNRWLCFALGWCRDLPAFPEQPLQLLPTVSLQCSGSSGVVSPSLWSPPRSPSSRSGAMFLLARPMSAGSS